MAKRKLSMSLIVLIVAATTLVSGTYAWFLVGGLAELFDLGFGVIEAEAGIEAMGSAGSAYVVNEETNKLEFVNGYGTYLQRDNFKVDRETKGASDLLAENGRYAPVSSADGKTFHMVSFPKRTRTADDPNTANGYFVSAEPEKGRDYNDFTMRARSSGTDPVKAKLHIQLKGSNEAIQSARVCVTVDEGAAQQTYMYALANAGNNTTYAVVTDSLPSGVFDTDNNKILNQGDEGFNSSFVKAQETNAAEKFTYKTMEETSSGVYEADADLDVLPSNASEGKLIRVSIWIEGNDQDCLGKDLKETNLTVKIDFRKA